MIDRQAISTALAKTLAYLACGKTTEASQWARKLVGLLTDAGVVF